MLARRDATIALRFARIFAGLRVVSEKMTFPREPPVAVVRVTQRRQLVARGAGPRVRCGRSGCRQWRRRGRLRGRGGCGPRCRRWRRRRCVRRLRRALWARGERGSRWSRTGGEQEYGEHRKGRHAGVHWSSGSALRLRIRQERCPARRTLSRGATRRNSRQQWARIGDREGHSRRLLVRCLDASHRLPWSVPWSERPTPTRVPPFREPMPACCANERPNCVCAGRSFCSSRCRRSSPFLSS